MRARLADAALRPLWCKRAVSGRNVDDPARVRL